MWRALEKVRNLLLRILNKQFLIFLFFLILSSVFWLIMTLNETYEKEMTIPLRLAGVPRKVVITDEPDSVVRFTVRDKGYMIALQEFEDSFYQERPRQVLLQLWPL